MRARGLCEYCLLPEDIAFFAHEPDHILARKHGGETRDDNLALSCFDCNRFKGSDIASIDPISGEVVPLFNPRTQQWNDHFENDGGRIVPLTTTGRATARLLRLNMPERIEVRQALSDRGAYPNDRHVRRR
ncbi:MAG TPA: HNH endonuclease signature motif containing protein [Blastocatellia bacterium]|nr:HNH endonuclease signature motif containing protein [Blastocatellia bacterium]